jgi:hypothetical protein
MARQSPLVADWPVAVGFYRGRDNELRAGFGIGFNPDLVGPGEHAVGVYFDFDANEAVREQCFDLAIRLGGKLGVRRREAPPVSADLKQPLVTVGGDPENGKFGSHFSSLNSLTFPAPPQAGAA